MARKAYGFRGYGREKRRDLDTRLALKPRLGNVRDLEDFSPRARAAVSLSGIGVFVSCFFTLLRGRCHEDQKDDHQNDGRDRDLFA